MEKLIINGNKKLEGEVKVSASKNACLPILFATLLTDKKVKLCGLPELRDIKTSIELLEKMGGGIT